MCVGVAAGVGGGKGGGGSGRGDAGLKGGSFHLECIIFPVEYIRRYSEHVSALTTRVYSLGFRATNSQIKVLSRFYLPWPSFSVQGVRFSSKRFFFTSLNGLRCGAYGTFCYGIS